MKAPQDDQRKLLSLQEVDREIDQVLHKRQQAADGTEIAALADQAKALTRTRIEAETAAVDCTREMSRLETDLAQVRRRREIQQGRLDRSEGSARELAGLEEELAHIGRRIDELENSQLALMERQEALEAKAQAIVGKVDELRARASELKAGAGTQVKALDDELTHLRANRQVISEGLDADLLDLYDEIRSNTGGIGAVAVYGHRVEGMPLELSPLEADRLRAAAPDEVVQSEEYDVILVRMPQ